MQSNPAPDNGRRLIDQQRLALAKARARTRLAQIEGADFLLQAIGDDLADRLGVVARQFSKTLLIAPDHPAIRQAVDARTSGAVHVIDEAAMHDDVLGTDARDFDLVVSIGQFHLMDDVPGMLVQLRERMTPDGLLIACVPGADTLANVRQAWIGAEAEASGGAAPRFLPLFDVRSVGGLLQRAGFALPVSDVEPLTVSYGRLQSVFADLRSMAGGNVLLASREAPLPRGVWRRLSTWMDTQTAGGARLEVVFQLIWMSGWSPSADQPKPLKPGSAQVSLADVLKR
ncbi:MAG: methyltransferase domain-containing protein [Pseudomonadota bacterium]